MKKSFTWLLAIVILVSLTLNLVAFTNAQETLQQKVDKHILVEIYEVPSYPEKGIHIHFGEGKTEVVPFHEFEKENHSKNGELIISTINRLEEEGYDLTHVSSGLASSGMITKVWMAKR